MRIRMLVDSATVTVDGRSCTVSLYAPIGGGYLMGIIEFADEVGYWGFMDGLDPKYAREAWKSGFTLRPAPVPQAVARALIAAGHAEELKPSARP